MKWRGNRESDNIEDRRAEGGSSGRGGLGGQGIGIGSIAIALVVSYFLGVSPLTVLNVLSGGGSAPQTESVPAGKPPANDPMAQFVATVLADTEDVWKEVFTQGGATYQEPRLVLFRGSTPTACGQGQSAMGPFYCPSDQKVYIDLDFYETLKNQLGAPGDFAQAYVIAHEVGHHVQNLMGITAQMDERWGRVSQSDYNALSARQILENGDVEEAMNAAAKIGDDALQRAGGGAVVPDSFTHGTSAQRQRWFNTGLKNGSMKGCDAFAARQL